MNEYLEEELDRNGGLDDSSGGPAGGKKLQLNDIVIIEDASLDQGQFDAFGKSPSSVSRPGGQGAALSRADQIQGDRPQPVNESRVSGDDLQLAELSKDHRPDIEVINEVRQESDVESAQISEDDGAGGRIQAREAMSLAAL